MASSDDVQKSDEPDLITDSDTGTKESDLNDTLDSKYDSVTSGSEKVNEPSSEPGNESEYESVDEDLHVTKKESPTQDSEVSQISREMKIDKYDNASDISYGSDKEEGELTISSDNLSDVNIDEEREEGDGEEESLSAKDKKLDHDEDRRNPQYIPKKGTFYEHDDRTVDEGCEEAPAEKEVEEGELKEEEKKKWRKEAALQSKWQHDLYNENEQAPKTTQELIDIYGYDIRNEEAPPKARRHRRYGRGPNKYTRNWEDENAYVKPVPSNRKPGRMRGGGGSQDRKGRTFFADNENFNLEREFPELTDKRPFKPPSDKGLDNMHQNKSGSVIKNTVFYNKSSFAQQQNNSSEPTKQHSPNLAPASLSDNNKTPITGKLHTSRNPPPQAFSHRNKAQVPKPSLSVNNTQTNGIELKTGDENLKSSSERASTQPISQITASDFPRGRAKKVLVESTYAFQHQQQQQHQVGVQRIAENPSESNEEELSKNFSHLQVEPTQHFTNSSATQSVPLSIPMENHMAQDNSKLQTQVAGSVTNPRGKRYSTQRQRSLPESGISFSPPPATFQQPPSHFYPPQTYGTGHQNVYTPKNPAANPVLTQQPSTQTPPMQLVYLQSPAQPPPPAQFQAPPPQIINYVPQPFTNPAAAYQHLTMPPPMELAHQMTMQNTGEKNHQECNSLNPPQPELYQPSGITYYSAQTQAVIPRQTPPRRIKAAIPIVPPPTNETNNRGQRSSSEEEKNSREFYNQETLQSSAG